jgi:uncharacterized protein YozE (UPF0346 family)
VETNRDSTIWTVAYAFTISLLIYTTEERKPTMSKSDCERMAHHMIHPVGIPQECKKYDDVVQYLKRHDSDTAHPTQWMS